MTPPPPRALALARLANEEHELLVVGGGATGAGIARDAATRGLRVALVEAGDFAGQTSSQSSRLIHGGLRYLQYGNLGLVFEGLAERRNLMATAPHLCRPVEFLFPGYRGERPGLSLEGLGIGVYNALALWRPPATRRRLDAHAVYALAPELRSANLLGAQCYVDCQTDDARLVLENVLDAESCGAVVLSHAPVVSVDRDARGRVRGVTVLADPKGEPVRVRARVVVNATGPFSDAFDRGRRNLRPTLGVHIVVSADRLPHGGRVVVLRAPQDNRLLFVLPAGPRTVVGTTDTDWPRSRAAEGAPRVADEIRAHRADVEYLLAAVNHGYPPARLGPDDVLATTAGLRPLIATSAGTPSQTSREHELVREPDGLLTIVGGKLTTLRRMGEQVVDIVAEILRGKGREEPIGPSVTATRPLPGGGPPPPLPADRDELPPDVRDHLAAAYGSRVLDVLALRATAPALASRIDPELPYLWAEVVHAIQHEHAREVADVLMRRVPLFRQARDQGLGAAPLVAASLGEILGWSSARRQASLEDYEAAVARSRAWRQDARAGA
jgi:glycerol-3-phosphate dehydrogenase